MSLNFDQKLTLIVSSLIIWSQFFLFVFNNFSKNNFFIVLIFYFFIALFSNFILFLVIKKSSSKFLFVYLWIKVFLKWFVILIVILLVFPILSVLVTGYFCIEVFECKGEAIPTTIFVIFLGLLLIILQLFTNFFFKYSKKKIDNISKKD